jgi:hypothetical protein
MGAAAKQIHYYENNGSQANRIDQELEHYSIAKISRATINVASRFPVRMRTMIPRISETRNAFMYVTLCRWAMGEKERSFFSCWKAITPRKPVDMGKFLIIEATFRNSRLAYCLEYRLAMGNSSTATRGLARSLQDAIAMPCNSNYKITSLLE